MPITRNDLEPLVCSKEFPDKRPYSSLSVEAVRNLSERSGVSARQVELAALEHGIVPERYARNMRTFSLTDQAVLLRAHAAVIGLGGLGGTVVEILSRMGVGRLTLIDGDRFEDSNLNRQLLSSVANLTTGKAEAARQRISQINPSVDLTVHTRFIGPENAAGLLADCDVVVDCLDNLRNRFQAEDACRSMCRPLVSAAVAGSSGHLTTIFPEDRGLRLIYGDPEKAPLKGAETALGTVPYAVTFLAALECAEVAKIILGRGNLLRHKLLVADLMEGVIDVMNLTP